MKLETLLERWNALPSRVRLAAFVAAGVIIFAAALVTLLSRDTRVPLFAAGLKPDQLAEVDAQLSAWNVSYAPAHDNVRVDVRHRGELLARLALAGVPHAHVAGTSEMLANAGTLTPQTILDAQARAGLEGDLEKGLRGLGGIADARVIIAPARGGTFADETPTPATASVRLTAAPGVMLTTSTLSAVREFVAAGVPGLDAAHVTVVDDRGAFDERSDDATERETALQSALDAAFGAGTTIVRVHVERAQSSSESRDVRRAPAARAVAHHELDERFSGDKKSYTRRQTSEDRGSDVHEQHTVIAAGAIERISIAVIVDARRSFDLGKIREVAAAASGLDARRGDTLSVDAVPFDRAYSASPKPFAYALSVIGEALPAMALAVVAIVAIRSGARPAAALVAEFSRRRTLQRTAPEMRVMGAERIFGALRGEPPHVAAAIVATLGTPLAAAVLDLYPADERREIVVRLSRRRAPLVADLGLESLLHGR